MRPQVRDDLVSLGVAPRERFVVIRLGIELDERVAPEENGRSESRRYLGIPGGFDGFLAAVLDLRKKIGVPHDLKGLGVDGSRVDTIVEMSLVDPTAGGNPVPLTKEGSRKLFDAALKGDVVAAGT